MIKKIMCFFIISFSIYLFGNLEVSAAPCLVCGGGTTKIDKVVIPSVPKNINDTTSTIDLDLIKIYNEYVNTQNYKYIKLNFVSTHGVPYSKVIDNSEYVYLTCKGSYTFEYLDEDMRVLNTGQPIDTTEINSNVCNSYGNQKEIDTNVYKLTDSNNVLVNKNEGYRTDQYVLFPDQQYPQYFGEMSETTHFGTEPGKKLIFVTYAPDGSLYDVVTYDSNIGDYSNYDKSNNAVGEDGLPNGDSGNGGGAGSGCDACKMLTDLLACPAWDDYMTELTQAIQNALPPPPNWQEVAEIFVNEFADYFGDVPTTPTKNEIKQAIEPQQPTLDTHVEGADIIPLMPSEFNNAPLDTSITNGEQIEIIQESQAFEIYEPTEFIEHDAAGVMVYPNDSRNSSNGIKTPDTITTNYEQPTPQRSNDNNVPPSEQPQPTMPEHTTPLPSIEDAIMPIPKYYD